MSLRQGDIVIDCHDHEAVVPFWQAALGWERHDVNQQYVALIPPPVPSDPAGQPHVAAPDGQPHVAAPSGVAGGPQPLPMLFQKVPEPKMGKNRMHIDFRSGDRLAEVARLVGLGAREGATRSLGTLIWTVMEDPEGNEFCVQ